jgi:serine/threonine protein kinase
MSSTSPSRVGHYELERQLGRGAIGTVYAARDVRIGRRVALKTIQLPAHHFEDATAAKDFFRRLQREAEVSGSLLHQNIVTLYEVAYENERVSYLAMELVEGETLLDLMKRVQPAAVPLQQAMRVAVDVLRGLAHAHGRGIVHRDIKPANILIGGDGKAKVADFGIARPQQSSLTASGSLIGTPNYMAPEQVTGAELTPRADLFSLGVVLYEMLTATRPFAANDITGILHNILRQEPRHVSEINPAVPRPVGDFIARLMRKSPLERPSTDEALAAAERLVQTADHDETLPLHYLRRRVQPAVAIGVLAGAVLAAAIPLIVLIARIDDSPTVTLPRERVAEFESKRLTLRAAEEMFAAGRHEESLRAYEAYLQKYPWATAAAAGRDRAAAAMAEAKKPPVRRRSSADEDISPRELLERMKRALRR